MADKITDSENIEVTFGFADDDTRKVKVPNPLYSYSTSLFTALEAALKPTLGGTAVDFILGDRNKAAFTGILYADKVVTRKTDFDLKN